MIGAEDNPFLLSAFGPLYMIPAYYLRPKTMKWRAPSKQCLALTIAALAIYTPLYQESGAFKEATNKVTKAVTWNR